LISQGGQSTLFLPKVCPTFWAHYSTAYHPYGLEEYRGNYRQTFAYDNIGNLTRKISTSGTTPRKTVGQNLNYNLGYTYYEDKSHQAEIIGDIYYRYDGNGNVTEARQGGHSSAPAPSGEVYRNGDLRYTDYGFALARGNDDNTDTTWERTYQWDEENRLKQSVEGDLTVDYRYGADGQRAVKYSSRGETLYFDSMWQAATDYPNIRESKHLYVGRTRIATRLNLSAERTWGYAQVNTYYYHPDHVGSAQLITDYQGAEYERIEYTPYGELWVEKTSDGFNKIPFRFTGKELDEETGLYYYGARYLDPSSNQLNSSNPGS